MADVNKFENVTATESSSASIQLPRTAIDTTVAGANANSYCTLNEAELYMGKSLYTGTWSSQSQETKEKALMYATMIMDRHMIWNGAAATSDQVLNWPRYGAVDKNGNTIDSNVIPQDIKNATAEVAVSFITANRLADPETAGFKFLQVEQLKAVVDKRDRVGVFTRNAWAFLMHYGVQASNAPRRLERV